MSRRITIFDTTLRDGEQSPGIALSPDEKAEIGTQLERLGVDVVEAGFAVSSPGDFEGVRAVAAAVERPTVASLARTKKEDIDAAAEALADARRSRIHVFLATSPIHMERKLRLEPAEVLEQTRWAVAYAEQPRRRGRVLLRGRHALRPGLRRRGLPRGRARRRDDHQPPGHGRLLPAGGVRRLPPRRALALPPAPQRHALGSLPRRPGPRGRQHARRRPGRGDPDRVHDQRARRAGRQRRARGGRHGPARPRGDLRVRDRRRRRRDRPLVAAGLRADRLRACSATRPSSARTRSPTRPASTRTGCSRTPRRTRSWTRPSSASR